MKILQWIVRIYMWIIIIWALSTWFPDVPFIITKWLGLLGWPVYKAFGWARIGPLNLAPVIALILLWWADSALNNLIGKGMPGMIASGEDQPPPPAGDSKAG